MPLFSCPCYAVGAEKALLQAVLRVRIWRGKGFIPYPETALLLRNKSTAKGVIELISLNCRIPVIRVFRQYPP